MCAIIDAWRPANLTRNATMRTLQKIHVMECLAHLLNYTQFHVHRVEYNDVCTYLHVMLSFRASCIQVHNLVCWNGWNKSWSPGDMGIGTGLHGAANKCHDLKETVQLCSFLCNNGRTKLLLQAYRLRGRVPPPWPSGLGRGTPWPCLKLRCAGGREFNPRPGKYSRISFSSDQVTCTVFSSEHAFPSKFWIIFRTLSSWGSGNYRPSAPFLWDSQPR